MPDPPRNNTRFADQLAHLLRDLCLLHEELLAALACQRAAIAKADADALAQSTETERQLIEAIGSCEQQHLSLLREHGEVTADSAAEAPTISGIASGFPEPTKGNVLSLAAKVRGLILQVRREGEAIRQAGETLSHYLIGLLQLIQTASSRSGVYGRDGKIGGGPSAVAGALDVRN